MYSFIVGSLLNTGLCPDGSPKYVTGFLRIVLEEILDFSFWGGFFLVVSTSW